MVKDWKKSLKVWLKKMLLAMKEREREIQLNTTWEPLPKGFGQLTQQNHISTSKDKYTNTVQAMKIIKRNSSCLLRWKNHERTNSTILSKLVTTDFQILYHQYTNTTIPQDCTNDDSPTLCHLFPKTASKHLFLSLQNPLKCNCCHHFLHLHRFVLSMKWWDKLVHLVWGGVLFIHIVEC